MPIQRNVNTNSLLRLIKKVYVSRVHSVVSHQQVRTAHELTLSPRTKLVFLPMRSFLMNVTNQTKHCQPLLCA